MSAASSDAPHVQVQPRLIPQDQARRCLLKATLGAMALAASFVYAPWAQTGPVLCPMRWLAGVPCPGCGLTRSFCAMAHGEWLAAFGWHILGPALFLALVIGVPALAFQGFTRRAIPIVDRILFSRRIAYVFATVLIAYHAVRVIAMTYTGALWTGVRESACGTMFSWMFG